MKRAYKIGFIISVVLTVMSVVFLAVFGLRLGVDFKGGSVMEIKFLENEFSQKEISQTVAELDYITGVMVQPTNGGALIRFGEIGESEHQQLLGFLSEKFGKIEEKRFDSIGPVLGSELKRKSVYAIIVLFLAITVYIAAAFRRLKTVLSPWAMGAAALLALSHDVAITAGVFSVLGVFYLFEINSIFVAAALMILGYSVSDSVIVFDRVRENVIKFGRSDFGEIIHKSVMQTLNRSINTSLTTMLALFAVLFLGGDSVKIFSLAMIVGIFLGTYSSIFVVSPIIYFWSRTNGVKH